MTPKKILQKRHEKTDIFKETTANNGTVATKRTENVMNGKRLLQLTGVNWQFFQKSEKKIVLCDSACSHSSIFQKLTTIGLSKQRI